MSWIHEIDWAAGVPVVAGLVVVIACLVGIFLTVLTLPGAWIAIAVSLLVWWWQPQMFEWWTFLIALIFAALGEVVEFAAGALGAAKAGASKKGMIGATIGTLLGAIIGTFFGPIIGSIIGGVLGAALGAFVGEFGFASRHWKDAGKASAGAAIGRVLATIGKTIFAGAVALTLCLAVLF